MLMKKPFFLLFLLAISAMINAQDFQASALYSIKNLSQPENAQNYILTFDATTSVYQPEKSLPQDEVLYKNSSHLTRVQSKKWNAKSYLINDALIALDWKLESQTKVILGYSCQKATAQNGQIVAWFTPAIPTAQGPANYFGLPGLILEVATLKQHILCSHVQLLSQNKTPIQAPTIGQKITQKQWDELVKKK